MIDPYNCFVLVDIISAYLAHSQGVDFFLSLFFPSNKSACEPRIVLLSSYPLDIGLLLSTLSIDHLYYITKLAYFTILKG